MNTIPPKDIPPFGVSMKMVKSAVWRISLKSPICVKLCVDLVIIWRAQGMIHIIHILIIHWAFLLKRWAQCRPVSLVIFKVFPLTSHLSVNAFNFVFNYARPWRHMLLPSSKNEAKFSNKKNEILKYSHMSMFLHFC